MAWMKGDDGRVEDAPGKDGVGTQRVVRCVVAMEERKDCKAD